MPIKNRRGGNGRACRIDNFYLYGGLNSMRHSTILALIVFASISAALLHTGTKLTWFGHAAFSITTPKGKVLVIEPVDQQTRRIRTSKKRQGPASGDHERADYILLTHGHRDHVGDAVEIAKKYRQPVLISKPGARTATW